MKKLTYLIIAFGLVCVGMFTGCQKQASSSMPAMPATNAPAMPATNAPQK